MAKQRNKGPSYPAELLDDVAWSFIDPPFASREAFVQAVADYYKDLEWECEWRPDEVVLPAARVRVMVEYWDEPGELWAELTAGREEGFTAGELLFKIHNAFAPQLCEGDHHFFEGLMLVKKRNANPNEPPVYEVMTGS
jgi:hypothetical protein